MSCLTVMLAHHSEEAQLLPQNNSYTTQQPVSSVLFVIIINYTLFHILLELHKMTNSIREESQVLLWV